MKRGRRHPSSYDEVFERTPESLKRECLYAMGRAVGIGGFELIDKDGEPTKDLDKIEGVKIIGAGGRDTSRLLGLWNNSPAARAFIQSQLDRQSGNPHAGIANLAKVYAEILGLDVAEFGGEGLGDLPIIE